MREADDVVVEDSLGAVVFSVGGHTQVDVESGADLELGGDVRDKEAQLVAFFCREIINVQCGCSQVVCAKYTELAHFKWNCHSRISLKSA